ncbi:MAG TPA: TetR/AcrR family transcriptional regulator [Jatrophihabitans sp.]|nr:TetR/AcrR family transcriptional regulator [Jatrophihabitans sp.]
MGRNRGFDEGQVLRAAADTFVRGGYQATSIDDLVTALGVHRGSLYNAFGSKRGLFLKTLNRYIQSELEPLAGSDPDGVADELVHRDTLDLVLVAAIERGHDDAQVAAAVRSALSAVERALRGSADADAAPDRAVEVLGARLYARLTQ